jgi:exoribonuclease-2
LDTGSTRATRQAGIVVQAGRGMPAVEGSGPAVMTQCAMPSPIPDGRHVRERLHSIARRALIERGFEPDLPAAAVEELRRLGNAPLDGRRDLRSLPWSSIDNPESRDLDQLEVIEDAGGWDTRLLVAIADVDALVRRDTALDVHARRNTTSVYTPAAVFPMLPAELSTDRTSLNEGGDRAAIVIQMDVDADGSVRQSDVYAAIVRSRAKLAYPDVSAWLDHERSVDALDASAEIARQLRAQDALAERLRSQALEQGALELDRSEPEFTVDDVHGVRERGDGGRDRARGLIEAFMIAANGATARFLRARGYPSVRRVVREPRRWPRIVEIAARYGATLPSDPDATALQQFLRQQRTSDPSGFGELSLTIIKLLGSGEYEALAADEAEVGHFALARRAYTHATAPNRRFPDLITQRLVKAALSGAPAPYDLGVLRDLAAHCTRQEDAANKVERLVRKAAAALWISSRTGEFFDGVITGASSKGTWVRLRHPAIEGKLEKGYEGLDVGDRVRVRLVHTDAERGFIDFERA